MSPVNIRKFVLRTVRPVVVMSSVHAAANEMVGVSGQSVSGSHSGNHGTTTEELWILIAGWRRRVAGLVAGAVLEGWS